MRTTVTLDPDVVALIEKELRRRKTTFKQVINDTMRRGFAAVGSEASQDSGEEFRTPVHDSGGLLRPFESASQILAEMDEERWLETH